MKFEHYLKTMVDKGGSDLFLTVGIPPSIKQHGKVTPIDETPLSAENVRELVLSIMNEKQRKEFIATKEMNFAILRLLPAGPQGGDLRDPGRRADRCRCRGRRAGDLHFQDPV